ncbi:MAG: cobalamin-independent methionine synthase II family protein [Gammaproteobacteria bacterium]
MTTSADRILTTHVGSLPRPDELADLLVARENGETVDEKLFQDSVEVAVANAVQAQVSTGIDIISDGEMSKIGFSTYIKDRCSGFSGDSPRLPPGDLEQFPDYMAQAAAQNQAPPIKRPACTGDIQVVNRQPLEQDIARFKRILASSSALSGFMNASSPGIIYTSLPNEYYASDDEYLEALGKVMQEEFETIHAAGLTLQVDCPDLAMARHIKYKALSDEEFLREAGKQLEVLNLALQNIPAENVRLHICWGNYEGPHHLDIPLQKIVSLICSARAQVLSFEASNPRHAHEAEVWRAIDLPDDKILMPGVIDTCTNYIDHPELVAERICKFANIVGRERVLAGTDCGFGTFTKFGRVNPSIAMEKLSSVVQGAEIASKRLWGGR